MMTDQTAFDWLEEFVDDADYVDVPPSIVPDAVWPSNNPMGIPVLDLQMCAPTVIAPLVGWGAKTSRLTRRQGGTMHFYTEDYRFEALWTNPAPVPYSGVVAAIEPNFSIYDDMPEAVAIWHVYRKRWIARWWQWMGLQVIVDLNVSERHANINRLGVPAGWTTFATRGYTERLDAMEREYAIAQEIAAGKTVNFVVYGGGKQVRARVEEHGWLWVPEQRDVWKGRWNG